MNKEQLQKKMDEAVEQFNQVVKNIEELTTAREQIRGKVIAYQEMLEEKPTSPAQLELVADEETELVE